MAKARKMFLPLSKREAGRLLEEINGPSVVDPVLGDLYYRLKDLIEVEKTNARKRNTQEKGAR